MGALADNLSIHELSGQKQPHRSQELSQELINVASENQHRSKSAWICLKTTLFSPPRWFLTNCPQVPQAPLVTGIGQMTKDKGQLIDGHQQT